MKKVALVVVVVVMTFLVVGIACTASAAIVEVDGNNSEWSTDSIILMDSVGDCSPDFVDLRIMNDEVNLYILYSFAEPYPDDEYCYLLIDADTNANTGFSVRGENLANTIGMEYGITFSEHNSYIGDSRNGGWGPNDFPGALNIAFGENFIEASVPIDVLRILSPELRAIDIITHNDFCGIRHYELTPIPIPCAVWLLGSGLLGLVGIKRKINHPATI